MVLPAPGLCLQSVQQPTLVVDEARARRNLERMAMRAATAGVRLRPHMKTHQSQAVGAWFREAGARECTVASVSMAQRFLAGGWDDLTIAFPLVPQALPQIEELAGRARVGVTIAAPEAAEAVACSSAPLAVWLKVDVGYGRAGVRWDNPASLEAAVQPLRTGHGAAQLVGLLTHAGHSYHASSPAAIDRIHLAQCERIVAAREVLESAGWTDLQTSIGDTPTCARAESFPGVDEIRPGNYVFHDLTQVALGVCELDDVAAAVVCPVVAVGSDRALLHGGAVHVSKDRVDWNGQSVFGLHVPNWATQAVEAAPQPAVILAEVSQEHGTLRGPAEALPQWGEVATIIPAHSCLAADLHPHYLSLDGTRLDGRGRT